jgi:hypothetical protein
MDEGETLPASDADRRSQRQRIVQDMITLLDKAP